MMILFFLRGKAEEKRRDFSLQKKRTKAARKKEKIPPKRISYSQSTNTHNTVGRKNARTATDLVRFCRSPRD